MGKKEVKVMNLKPRVEKMEGACRATGISSTAVLCGFGVKNVVPNPEVSEKASYLVSVECQDIDNDFLCHDIADTQLCYRSL